MRLSQTRLLVSDVAACFRFYRDVVGLRVTWGDEQSGYVSFATGEEGGDDAMLALFDRAEMAAAVGGEPEQGAADRVVLVFEVPDVDAALAALRDQGADVAAEAVDRPGWGIRTAHVRDPDGNLIELAQELPMDAWSEDARAEAARVAE
jgi:catechol 2,3-dioxygenase-like lactoylglutathione lyase family enzyme